MGLVFPSIIALSALRRAASGRSSFKCSMMKTLNYLLAGGRRSGSAPGKGGGGYATGARRRAGSGAGPQFSPASSNPSLSAFSDYRLFIRLGLSAAWSLQPSGENCHAACLLKADGISTGPYVMAFSPLLALCSRAEITTVGGTVGQGTKQTSRIHCCTETSS